MKLLRVPLRIWLVVGTAAAFVVGVFLVVLAYRGWTFGLGTHDKPTLVTVALTADALFFGFVAAVLALAAYCKQFVLITTESALRWRVADNQVMSDQLDHLLSTSSMPNVRLGVIPLAVRAHEVPLTSFCLYDDRLCTVETFSGEVIFRDPRDVAIH